MDIGELIYIALLIVWSAYVAYLIFDFCFPPKAPVSFPKPAATPVREPRAAVVRKPHTPEPPRSYSSHEGFKSFQRGTELTVEDIVTGLSREKH